eukprot:scaffold2462_cov402-Prasinococcus_capsulatus_cf.AAC.29
MGGCVVLGDEIVLHRDDGVDIGVAGTSRIVLPGVAAVCIGARSWWSGNVMRLSNNGHLRWECLTVIANDTGDAKHLCPQASTARFSPGTTDDHQDRATAHSQRQLCLPDTPA